MHSIRTGCERGSDCLVGSYGEHPFQSERYREEEQQCKADLTSEWQAIVTKERLNAAVVAPVGELLSVAMYYSEGDRQNAYRQSSQSGVRNFDYASPTLR